MPLHVEPAEANNAKIPLAGSEIQKYRDRKSVV